MKHGRRPLPPDSGDTIKTVHRIARFLNVSVATLYVLMQSEQPPPIERTGSGVRTASRKRLAAWMKAR